MLCHKENRFPKAAPQVAYGIRIQEDCVHAEPCEEGVSRRHITPDRRQVLNYRYREKTRVCFVMHKKGEYYDSAE